MLIERYLMFLVNRDLYGTTLEEHMEECRKINEEMKKQILKMGLKKS